MSEFDSKICEITSSFKTLNDILEHRFAVTPAMLHSIDDRGVIVSVSDTWLEKLGFARHEVTGRKSSEFLTPESRDYAISSVLPKFFETGRCDNIEYQMVAKDGKILDVLYSAILDVDYIRKSHQSICVVTDITSLKATKMQLAQSEARYRNIVEDQSELVSLAAPDGTLLFANHAYAELYGFTQDEMAGRNLFDFVAPEHRTKLEAHFRCVLQTNICLENQNEVILPNGQRRWISWSNRSIPGKAGNDTLIHSVGRDVHNRVMIEDRLRESEAKYRLLAENSSDMVVQIDRDMVRRYASPAFRDILGYEPERMVGIKSIEMVHPEDAPRVEMALRALIDGLADRQSVINRFRHREGHWVWVEAQLRAVKDPKTGAVLGITGTKRDVSKRMEIEEQLAEANRKLEALAREDALTGLANRRAFDAALETSFRAARRDETAFTLMMIDVDYFKSFNDEFGHCAGDECLKRVGAAIAESILRPRDFVARYGGEEFVVILPGTDEAGAKTAAERIRQAVIDLALAHGNGVGGIVTVSIGTATSCASASDENQSALFEAADRAMYRAKKAGRNKVVSDGGQSKDSFWSAA